MKVYEVWSEGYAATGERGGAHLIGRATGHDFKEACRKVVRRDIELFNFFNEDRLTIWGCRLYDNEADARKTFG